MGTYFYKKNCFFVHLKSTFQKTLGAASLLSTHCPGTGWEVEELLLVAPSSSFLSGLQGRRNHSFGMNPSPHYYMTIGQAAALTGEVHKRLPGEVGTVGELLWGPGFQHPQLRQLPSNYFCCQCPHVKL